MEKQKGNFMHDGDDRIAFTNDENRLWEMFHDPSLVKAVLPSYSYLENGLVKESPKPIGSVTVTLTPECYGVNVAKKQSEYIKEINIFLKGLRREGKFIKIRKLQNNPTLILKK